MIVSRALYTLIRLNHLINLSPITKTHFSHSHFWKNFVWVKSPGQIKNIPIRTMSSEIQKELENPKRHFDYKQLIQKRKESNVVVIDVRELSEINETGKIPGSIHIPLNNLKSALEETTENEFFNLYKSQKPKSDAEVIFTCRSGRRSLTVGELGKALGDLPPDAFEKLYHANKPQKDNEVIFSCKSGGRSVKALKLALELGYNKAGNYKGGWLDWAEKSKIE